MNLEMNLYSQVDPRFIFGSGTILCQSQENDYSERLNSRGETLN